METGLEFTDSAGTAAAATIGLVVLPGGALTISAALRKDRRTRPLFPLLLARQGPGWLLAQLCTSMFGHETLVIIARVLTVVGRMDGRSPTLQQPQRKPYIADV